MAKTDIKLTVNGQEAVGSVEPRTLLIHFLREQLGLTGPHIGCETSRDELVDRFLCWNEYFPAHMTTFFG